MIVLACTPIAANACLITATLTASTAIGIHAPQRLTSSELQDQHEAGQQSQRRSAESEQRWHP
jgi:hypothetical protein